MSPQLLIFNAPNAGQPESTHRLACWQWGDANASRTLLCVHGVTRNGRDFDFLARALCNDYRILCPDMPGRGQSEWLKDIKAYNNATYAADILYVLDQLKITRTDWVGTSMGGIIAMLVANMRPGLIGRLVLNDIGCIVSAAGLKRILAYAGTPEIFSTRAEAEAALRERFTTFGIKSEAHWQQLFAHSFQETAGGIRFACDPAVIASISPDDLAEDIDLWPLWQAVTAIPVLLVRGEESDILSRQTALNMQSRHPRLTLREISHTGHAPALMEDAQITMISDWLNHAM